MCGHELVLCIQKLERSLTEEGEGGLDEEIAAGREKTKIPGVFPAQLFYLELAFSDDNKC